MNILIPVRFYKILFYNYSTYDPHPYIKEILYESSSHKLYKTIFLK